MKLLSFLKSPRGLAQLIEVFGTAEFPPDTQPRKTTIQVGSIRYRRCAWIYSNQDGIYLRVQYIFKTYPVIFIPRGSVREVRPSTLFGSKALEFVLSGDPDTPSIRFYPVDLKAMGFADLSIWTAD